MSSYDFDDTIFRGNSMRRFSFFCTLRLPYLILYLPVVLVALFLRALRILNKNIYLLLLDSFVVFVPHAEKFVVKFWDKNIGRIKPWYLAQRQDSDVIVSASPNFLIAEACKRLGVRCIATDISTKAKLNGKHCHGAYKVEMFRRVYGDVPPEAYYSDSFSDKPMWQFSHLGYHVKGNSVKLVYRDGIEQK